MTVAEPFELLQVRLRSRDDVVTLRHLVRTAARMLGMADTDITRVATSISELGRLATDHLPLPVHITVSGDRTSLDVGFRLTGGEIPDGMRPGDPVHTVVARLMDRVELVDGFMVVAKALPDKPDASALNRVRDSLLVEPTRELRSVLESQNTELVAALLALRERESQLVSLNAELAETNRGVVALYNELEHRAAEVRHAHREVFEELGRTLRPPAPTVEGVEFGIRYLPAQLDSPTGGDLYDWLVMPDGSVHIAVVDVMGHGVTGSRDALSVTHVLRTLTLEGHELAALLERANDILQATATKVVATAFVARFYPTTGVLEVAGAGHPPALLVPATGPSTYLETTGRPIGYPTAGRGDVVRAQLRPGDCVIAYTDGLIEIRRDLVEGLQTLQESADAACSLPVQDFLDSVLARCTGDDVLRDDTLLLAMRWSPPGAASPPE